MMKYPKPLKAGSKIAITAFSAGVPATMHERLDNALGYLAQQGFELVVGECLRDNHNYVSADVKTRANELMGYLLDDTIDAIMPPWGGAIAMDLLTLLDWEKLAHAPPKWLIGFSDVSTLLSAVTCKLGWASVHATNLMQLNVHQQDALTVGLFNHLRRAPNDSFTQFPSTHFEAEPLNFVDFPDAGFNLSARTQWRILANGNHRQQFAGRLLGGCLDIHMLLAGTEYFDLDAFLQVYPNESIILYFENGEMPPAAYYRALQSIKLRGWFSKVAGVLIGRNPEPLAKDSDWTHLDALQNAFTGCDFPVLYDVDIGHQAPNLTLINGAYAEVTVGDTFSITQTLI
ncbi:S66 peptidase family protein [Pseudoalteromonas sp. OF7H-1]|uniref:S66 family peptidase n=1 Tax=Pseudoalteromonas sp. OF7H-1 TaxID=2917755 RepID=UPI001EF6AD6A|nr:S66 peptidase family protein [Pseudoalteromonas sp. OF7H-1]MCG7539221.1 LD-carboxypeptidase [Pseudoalteromonas sp. OF7H-1]